jgi:hypothetical protein
MWIQTLFFRVFHHEKLQEAIFLLLFATAQIIGNWVCGKHWVLGFFLGTLVFGFFALGFQWLIGDVEFGKVGETIVGVLATVLGIAISIIACLGAIVPLSIIRSALEDTPRSYTFVFLGVIRLLAYFGRCWVVVWLGVAAVGVVQVLVAEARKHWKTRKLARVRQVANGPSINR